MFDYLTNLNPIDSPDGVIRTLLRQTQKRAKSNDMEFSLDFDYLLKMWNRQKGKCALTKIPFYNQKTPKGARRPFFPSIDRKNNKKGYVKYNVRFVSVAVNMALFTWGEDVFDTIMIERFYQIPGEDDKDRLMHYLVDTHFGPNYIDIWLTLKDIKKKTETGKLTDDLVSESVLGRTLDLPTNWFSERRKENLELPPHKEVPRGENIIHRYYDFDDAISWFKNNAV